MLVLVPLLVIPFKLVVLVMLVINIGLLTGVGAINVGSGSVVQFPLVLVVP